MPRKRPHGEYYDPEFPLTVEIEKRKRKEEAEVQAKEKARRKKKWIQIRLPLFMVADGLIVSSVLYAITTTVKVGDTLWYLSTGAAIVTIGLTAICVRVLIAVLKK